LTEYTAEGKLTRHIDLEQPNKIWQHVRMDKFEGKNKIFTDKILEMVTCSPSPSSQRFEKGSDGPRG
jgi:hypothetical protein